jgi:hypothetical protein
MFPADVDPSLCTGEPRLDRLDDGFSPPAMNASTPTHPVEPEPMSPEEGDDGTPNPTQLPVEPEFGPQLPPGEPDDPGVTHPHI